MTRFTELTGCRVPVQQAPMGSVSTSALAVAVADAGGVGSMAAESGAHPEYKRAVTDAAAGATEINGAFSVCPLCATSPRARVLRSCVGALCDLDGETVGQTTSGGRQITLPKGHGAPPGAAATGHIGAMAMYAGESAASITAVEPAARIVESWAAAAERPR
jgi:nitronate monooxygenase